MPTISALTAGSAPTGAELVPVKQGSSTVSLTTARLMPEIQISLTGDHNVMVKGAGTRSDQDDIVYCSEQGYGSVNTVGHNVAHFQFSNDTSCAFFGIFKSRSGTKGTHAVVHDGDDLAEWSAYGSDGTNWVKTALITPVVNGSVSVGVIPTAIPFYTMNTSGVLNRRMHLSPNGKLFIGTDTATYAQLEVQADSGNEATSFWTNAAATAVSSLLSYSATQSVELEYRSAKRASDSAFNFAMWYANTFGDLKFKFSGNGNGTCDGSWTGGGADYAEYFEWADGNVRDEDRRGMSVVLVGDKVKPATAADDNTDAIIGVVSVKPTVIGDDPLAWNSKYLTDELGSDVLEAYDVWEWDERTYHRIPGQGPVREEERVKRLSYASDQIPDGVVVPADKTITPQFRKKLNPDYDGSADYFLRSDRLEWAAIGLMGKLRVRKGQPTGTRWLKLREISENVDEWLVR